MKAHNKTSKIRIGIIGCGKVATAYHLPCYMKLDDVVVSSIYDPHKESLLSVSKKFGVEKTYTKVDEFMEEGSLDAVDICTPPFTHYRLCKKALEKGISNILVEKPLTLNFDEALDLQRLSEQRKAKICVVHNYRFRRPILKLLEMYRDGKIGKIEGIASIVHALSAFQSRDWRFDESKSGGILYESGYHVLDIQVLLCGDHKRIISTHSIYDKVLNHTTRISSVIEYENDAVGIIDLAAFSSSSLSYSHIFGTAMDVHIKFYPDYFCTTAGSFSFIKEFLSENRRFWGFAKNVVLGGLSQYHADYHYPIISRFIQCIKTNGVPPVSVADTLPTMKLLEDIKTSLG